MSSIQRFVSPKLPTGLANDTHIDLPGYDIWFCAVCLHTQECFRAYSKLRSTPFTLSRQCLASPSLKTLSLEPCKYIHMLRGGFGILMDVGL